MDALSTLAGLVLAVLGARVLVDGGIAIAKRFGIPSLVIGATVVAFGTSMPEFTVNLHSAIAGSTDLALGYILGSNVFNIAFIIGVVVLIKPLTVGQDSASKDLPMCLISALALGIAGNQLYLDHINYHELMPSAALLFFCFFGITMYYTYREAVGGATHKRTHPKNVDDRHAAVGLSTGRATMYIVGGLVGLVFGGELIVDGAQGLAKGFGLSERVIGLLIVGPGTSFPELIASIVAARKGNVGMVMGNVLGSNIFNIFFTLGVTAMIKPVPLDLQLNQVVIANIVVTALLVLWVTVLRRRQLGRLFGVVLLAAYAANMILSLRG